MKWPVLKNVFKEILTKKHPHTRTKKSFEFAHAFVIYLELMEKYPDRFLTGTDFVSSMGEPMKYPGMKTFKDPPSGCMKDEANHRRQVTG